MSVFFRALLFLIAFLAPVQVPGATINLGVISFDTVIPGDPQTPGVNAFNVTNLTGTFALPPDFPVVDPITFINSTANLLGTTISIGDITPGSASLTALTFPDTQLFPFFTLVGSLSQTSFILADGTTFTATSNSVMASLRPSIGSTLTPGVDFAVITVSDIPEPATTALSSAVVFGLVLLNRRRSSK